MVNIAMGGGTKRKSSGKGDPSSSKVLKKAEKNDKLKAKKKAEDKTEDALMNKSKESVKSDERRAQVEPDEKVAVADVESPPSTSSSNSPKPAAAADEAESVGAQPHSVLLTRESLGVHSESDSSATSASAGLKGRAGDMKELQELSKKDDDEESMATTEKVTTDEELGGSSIDGTVAENSKKKQPKVVAKKVKKSKKRAKRSAKKKKAKKRHDSSDDSEDEDSSDSESLSDSDSSDSSDSESSSSSSSSDDKKKKKKKKSSKKKKSKKAKKAKKRKVRNLKIYDGINYLHKKDDPGVVQLQEPYEVYVLEKDLSDALDTASSVTQFIRNITLKVYTPEALANATPLGFPDRSKGASHTARTMPRLHPDGRSAILARAVKLEDVKKSWRPRVGDTKMRNAFSGIVNKQK